MKNEKEEDERYGDEEEITSTVTFASLGLHLCIIPNFYPFFKVLANLLKEK